MLSTMSPTTRTAPISTVVNTHANGDHCYGNQLLAGSGDRRLDGDRRGDGGRAAVDARRA